MDEIKLGVLDHDIGIFRSITRRGGADLNLELLFGSPAFLKFIGAPRPHIGMDVNSDDNTNQFYLGLTWNGDLISSVLGKSDAIYVQGSLGGAIHDGQTEGDESPTQKRLGSRRAVPGKRRVRLAFLAGPEHRHLHGSHLQCRPGHP